MVRVKVLHCAEAVPQLQPQFRDAHETSPDAKALIGARAVMKAAAGMRVGRLGRRDVSFPVLKHQRRNAYQFHWLSVHFSLSHTLKNIAMWAAL